MNVVLKQFVSLPSLRNSSLLVPVAAISCLRNFLEMTLGRVLLLTGDKAYNSLDELKGHRDPHIAVHGSFSTMVNFVALRLWVEAMGRALGPGTRAGLAGSLALATPRLDGFKVALFALGAGAEHLIDTRMAFADCAQFGPDDFSTLQRSMKEGPFVRMCHPLLDLTSSVGCVSCCAVVLLVRCVGCVQRL
jgi:hypothetical protein